MLEQILAALPGTPPKEALNEDCLQWARDHGVSEQLIRTLDACAYAGPIRIGPVSLSRLAQLDAENADEAAAVCVDHGFLIVGYGPNGDAIAVELASGKMTFVSHDDLWERTYGDFEECVVRTPLGFHEFWAAALTSPHFPADVRDAEESWPPST